MTEREKLTSLVEHFCAQGKADAEYHDRFMTRLSDLGRQAQAERRNHRKRRQRRAKGTKK